MSSREQQDQIDQYRQQLATLPDGMVKDAIRETLSKLEKTLCSEHASSASDAAVQRVCECATKSSLHHATDALCLVLHFIVLEHGFTSPNGTSSNLMKSGGGMDGSCSRYR